MEAVTAAARLLPDVIVMDVAMPGLDGIEAARHIKRDPRMAHVPVIALSALPSYGGRGAEVFAATLSKLCSPEDLFEAVARVTSVGG